ncbi:hypothetical protein Mgra_00007276 [Meloidogyne graminicola]|uniref:Uncharacterized protein n=1 Tax=Meloidogyne graminicola TaxID=189291 RepID=A0A8S9ZIZ9_9BILA|nr:hypothetical protein Mgra_00007276 [Meloidogyne graminicola]
MIQILLFILTLVFDKGFIEAEKRNVVVDLYPCPNCEEWCANKKYEFICEYTCNHTAKPGVNDAEYLDYYYEKYGTYRASGPEKVKKECNEKNINCIFRNNWYPLNKKCAPEYPMKDEIYFEIYKINDKYWANRIDIDSRGYKQVRQFLEWCGMKCNDSRPISRNPTRTKTTTTLATTTTPVPTQQR